MPGNDISTMKESKEIYNVKPYVKVIDSFVNVTASCYKINCDKLKQLKA